MADRSITSAEFGRDFLGGRSEKTAKQRIIADRIPYHLDGSHILILESDAEAWRESRRVEPEAMKLKSLVHAAVERAKRRKAAQPA